MSYTVIGVLPRDFHLPGVWGGMDQKKPQLFVPLNTSSIQAKPVLENRNLMSLCPPASLVSRWSTQS